MKALRRPAVVSSELIRSLNVFVALSGFLLKLVIFPLDVEVLPRISSPTTKSVSLVGSKNTLLIAVTAPIPLTLAVAPEVCPVTVSPITNVVGASTSFNKFSPALAVPSVLSSNKNPSMESSNFIAGNWSVSNPL